MRACVHACVRACACVCVCQSTSNSFHSYNFLNGLPTATLICSQYKAHNQWSAYIPAVTFLLFDPPCTLHLEPPLQLERCCSLTAFNGIAAALCEPIGTGSQFDSKLPERAACFPRHGNCWEDRFRHIHDGECWMSMSRSDIQHRLTILGNFQNLLHSLIS